MSLRSLLFFALLLVAAAAQSDDVYDSFMSVWLNMTPAKLCAVDAPSRCYYIPRIDLNIDPTKTLAVVAYRCGADGTCAVLNPIGDYQLLRYVVVSTPPPRWHIVYVPRAGLLYADISFRIGPPGSGDGGKVLATSYTACGKTYRYAYYAPPGVYNITPLPLPLYLVDLEKCVEYRIAASAGTVVNITAGWYSLYLAELKPDAQKIYYDQSRRAMVLNGTVHAYLTYFHGSYVPLGEGFYILQTRTTHVAQTLVMPQYRHGAFISYRGPVAYDAWRNFATFAGSPGVMYIHYNAGLPPGDGFFMAVLLGVRPPALAEYVYVTSGSAGYFTLRRPLVESVGAGYATYHTRYAVVHVAFSNFTHLYDTRGLACPMYGGRGTGWVLNRLDRAYEVEICNNNTQPVYVGLYLEGRPAGSVNPEVSPGFFTYMYGDVIQPRNCSRLRWDGAVVPKPQLRVYTTPRGLCAAANNYTLATTSYNPGWRYALVGNSLVPMGPIAPDYNYTATWLELLKYLNQLYKSILDDIRKKINATRSQNATAPFNLTSLFAGRQFLGTIRMDSATSTWLRTTLNELRRWHVAGGPAGGGVSVSLQAPSALTASAAAAAVATAWAASRRSLATAAFLAGFAVLSSALFVYYLYGTSVSAALIFAAVLLMSIGAAAAWFRKSED
jgi:hypothetical protein